jgi:hypothetical protein
VLELVVLGSPLAMVGRSVPGREISFQKNVSKKDFYLHKMLMRQEVTTISIYFILGA